jgi:hypothetical protein
METSNVSLRFTEFIQTCLAIGGPSCEKSWKTAVLHLRRAPAMPISLSPILNPADVSTASSIIVNDKISVVVADEDDVKNQTAYNRCLRWLSENCSEGQGLPTCRELACLCGTSERTTSEVLRQFRLRFESSSSAFFLYVKNTNARKFMSKSECHALKEAEHALSMTSSSNWMIRASCPSNSDAAYVIFNFYAQEIIHMFLTRLIVRLSVLLNFSDLKYFWKLEFHQDKRLHAHIYVTLERKTPIRPETLNRTVASIWQKVLREVGKREHVDFLTSKSGENLSRSENTHAQTFKSIQKQFDCEDSYITIKPKLRRSNFYRQIEIGDQRQLVYLRHTSEISSALKRATSKLIRGQTFRLTPDCIEACRNLCAYLNIPFDDLRLNRKGYRLPAVARIANYSDLMIIRAFLEDHHDKSAPNWQTVILYPSQKLTITHRIFPSKTARARSGVIRKRLRLPMGAANAHVFA